jgi:ABC-type glycerol-3-phosphate transport system permease component
MSKMSKGMAMNKIRRGLGRIFIDIQILFAFMVMAAPIVWLISTSIKSSGEMFSLPLRIIPKSPTITHYIKIWRDVPFLNYVRNSSVMALYSTVITLVISSFAAYYLSRFTRSRNHWFLNLILFAQMFPAMLLIIPIFIYIKKLGLLGTFTGLMSTYLTFLIPLSTWALTNFFKNIPKELDEAALIDGCSRLKALFKVILPVASPGLISVGTYCFLTAWNEFLYAMIFMSSQQMWTIPVGLNALSSQFAAEWGMVTAGGVICLIPATIVVIFLQNFLIAGLTAGSVKE